MAEINTLYAELNELKIKHHDVLEKLERKKREIAESICPLNIGDRVKIFDGIKTIEGVVDRINYCYKNLADQVLNNVGSRPTWGVQGKRINSTTGLIGKWGFSASPIFHDYEESTKTFTQKEDILSAMTSDE